MGSPDGLRCVRAAARHGGMCWLWHVAPLSGADYTVRPLSMRARLYDLCVHRESSEFGLTRMAIGWSPLE